MIKGKWFVINVYLHQYVNDQALFKNKTWEWCRLNIFHLKSEVLPNLKCAGCWWDRTGTFEAWPYRMEPSHKAHALEVAHTNCSQPSSTSVHETKLNLIFRRGSHSENTVHYASEDFPKLKIFSWKVLGPKETQDKWPSVVPISITKNLVVQRFSKSLAGSSQPFSFHSLP